MDGLLVPLILFGVAVVMVSGLVVLIVKRKGWGNFASLTAYHDFQPKNKQEAVENVIEKKSGKRIEGEESGEDK